MIKPVATNFKEEQAARGSGQFRDSIELLQQDKKSYYYQKFIDEQNQYLNDDMWTEAAKRGELDQLIFLLDKNKGTNQYVDKLNNYGVEYSYDDYMNALAIPQLDNTTKKDRVIDDYNFGSYTDKEWAEQVLQRTFEGLEAQIIESNKENLNFFDKFKGYSVSALSRLSGAVLDFGQDVANIGEGILNIFANYSNDDDIGDRFLWAFSDESDESVGDVADMFRLIAYDYERKYTTIVDANKAFEEGFSLNGVNLGSDNYYEAAKKVQGVNAGVDGWGKYWVNGIEAIGYMLPSMLIPGGKAASTATKGLLGTTSKLAVTAGKVLTASKPILFHAGIFSGMVSETVEYAKFNGISYKDLNSGEVIANAAIKTAAQFAIEKALGAVIGFSALDKMMGMGTARATIKAFRSIGKTGVKALPAVVGRFAKDAVKEGFEESLQDLSDSLIDYTFGGLYRDSVKQNFSIQNIVDSFVIGALTSGVIGSIANASVLLPSNRSIGINEKGDYYRLGVFQQLNYNQALQAMNEWNAILQDEKTSNQKKADAAFKMNIAIDTIGNVLRIMGNDRAIQANALLVELSKSKDIEAKSKAILELHNIDYANNLYNKFIQQSTIANLKYLSIEKKSKIKQAIDSVVSKFKKAKVTELSNVITEEIPNSEIDQNSGIGKLKAELKKFGVDLIIAVDGEIVTKSKDVLFVNNKLVEKGDITEIIKGASYDAVVSAVSNKLSKSQIKMLAQQYEKITGNTGDIEDVITALLFDKNFYTYSLLLSTERRYGNNAIETLITLDQVIKEASTKDAKGNIINKAQLALLNKVRETLRNGLVVYCTQYVNLDLSKISKEILPKELIKTIEEHANVRFTNFINEAVQDVPLSNKSVEESRRRRAEQYDAIIDRFASEIPLIKSISETLKRKARSNNVNDRVDAYTTLIALCKSEYGPSRKLVYLPSSNIGVFETSQINDIEAFMGVSIREFLANNFDSSLLSEEFTNLIVSSQTDISTPFSRRLALRELLFTRSNGTLTIGSNGSILRVITAENFLSKKFDKVENIDKAILDGIADSSIQKVQDLTDIKLPKEIADIPILVNHLLSGNGVYSVSTNEIIIKGVKAVNTLMHEITHATQMLSAIGANDNVVLGTSAAILNVLPDEVFNDLTSYIEKTFPNSYNVIRNLNENPEMAIYFMISGELEANSMFINQMYELGFTWSNNKAELISPDGKHRWSMRPDINKRLKYAVELAKNKAIEEDVPLTNSVIQKLRDDKEIMSFVKDSMFKDENGIPMVFYRGSRSEERQELGTRKDGTIYLSSKPYVARFFATNDRHDIGPFRGYVVNLKQEDVFVFDAENSHWSAIDFNGETLYTNEMIAYVKEHYPNYKAIYLKRVQEMVDENEDFGNDLILLKDISTSLKRITKEDNGEFVDLYTEYMYYKEPENEGAFNDFIYAYIAKTPNITNTDFIDMFAELRNLSNYIENNELKLKLITNYFKDNRYKEITKKLTDKIDQLNKDFIEKVNTQTNDLNEDLLYEAYNKDTANAIADFNDELANMEDMPLIRSVVQKLKEDKDVMSFVKESMFKDENGVPVVFYRGSNTDERQISGKREDGIIFLSSKPFVSKYFATHNSKEEPMRESGPFRAYVVNLKPEDVFVFDAKNAWWSNINFDNKTISANAIIAYIKEKYPNYKAVYIKNVEEVPLESSIKGDDLILLKDSNKALKRISKEDNGEFLDTYNEYNHYYLYSPREEFFINFMYAYAANYPNISDTDFFDKVIKLNETIGYWSDNINEQMHILEKYFATKDPSVITSFIKNKKKDFDEAAIDATSDKINNIIDIIDKISSGSANMEDMPLIKKLKDVSKEKESKLAKKRKEYFKSRYISNKIAKNSNLKYFIRKGRPIFMHENLKNFIISTTSDFDKLAKPLQEKIKNGSLTLFDIYDFVATANYIDDYTFKVIAKYIYNNENLSKLTYADMKKVLENIEFLAVSSYLLRETGVDNLILSIDELFQMSENVQNSLKNSNDVKLKQNYEKAYVLAQSVKVDKGQRLEASGDPMQMQSIFFRHFDGSLDSIVDINNLGKYMALKQKPQELIENVDTGTVESKGGTGNWNWIDNMKVAEINYYPERFESISRSEKEDVVINYLSEVIIERLNNLSEADRIKMAKAAKAKLEEESEKVHQSSDEVLNKKYLFAISTEFFKKDRYKLSNALVSEVSKKTIKDTIRNTGRTITKRIAGLKNNYKLLSDKAKEYFDPVTYKLNDKYQSLSESELTELNSILSDDLKRLTKAVGSTKTLLKVQETTSKRLSKVESKLAKEKEKTAKVESKLAKEKEKTAKLREQVKTLKESPNVKNGKTIREKILTKYRTVIKEQSFELTSNVRPNEVANSVLNTSWNKTRMSAVKGVDSNTEVTIANGKIFFEENAEILMNATTAELEEAAEWFLNSNLNNATDEDYEKFKAVKMYYLGYLFTDVTAISPELHKRIDSWLRRTQTVSGKMLSIWKNIRTKISPLDILKNQDIEIDGVSLTEGEKDRLFKAVEEGNLDALNENMTKIINRIADANKNKSSRIRKIIAIRAMSMLSSPMTWLRNIASNIVLKRLYNISDIIGQKVFSSKTIDNQILLKAKVTPEISDFINTHFIDNGLFETLVSNLSKYSSSDIRNDKPKALKDKPLTKEEIFSRMVLKSMYNKYYNENLFKSKVIKTIHEKIMEYMSDNNYIREASIKYLGKLMAEKGYDLSRGVTNEIVSDFGNAVGLAMNDYMHSNNVFNEVEKYIAKKGEGWLFVYKAILPFAATSYQWFKASIKTSPIGLINAIRKMTRLEQNVKKMEENWRSGKSDIPPELAEYFIRREFGQGVIGTIFWGAGLIAAALGFIKLEDDDYGIPKLKFDKLEVDVSSLFGSSSFLAGAAFVTAFTDKYDEDANFWTKLKEGLDRGVDVIVDGFPMMQIVEMDMYEQGGFSIGLNNLESYALSFIPNFLSWIAGATYPGQLRKNTFLGKAAAKIPFLGPVFNEYKTNPYTGKRGTWIDVVNRVIPYFSWDSASQIEETSKALGLNKTELKGKYEINGKSFEVTKEDLTKINEAYGSWNVEDLTKFYDNKLKVTIKVGTTYKSLSYSEMDSKQQKRAVEQLMEKNAKYAKILAWTMNGNKYQASNNEYLELLRRGIKTNVYRGTKGFIENQK